MVDWFKINAVVIGFVGVFIPCVIVLCGFSGRIKTRVDKLVAATRQWLPLLDDNGKPLRDDADKPLGRYVGIDRQEALGIIYGQRRLVLIGVFAMLALTLACWTVIATAGLGRAASPQRPLGHEHGLQPQSQPPPSPIKSTPGATAIPASSP